MVKLRANILLVVLAAAAAPPCAADETLDTAPIISALLDVAKDADQGVRNAAFNALKSQPRSDALLELFWRGVEDDSPAIRTLSLDKVVELEGPTEKVLTRLVVLASEPSIKTVDTVEMQRRAQSHLISIGGPAIPYLIDALKKDEASYLAIYALGQIPLGEYQTTVATQLTALLKSDDKDVRLAAVRSLQNIMIAEANAKSQAMIAEAKAKAQAEALTETGGVDRRYIEYYSRLLQKYDSNSDGSLTKDEWSKMSKDPAAADTDQNGKITVVEYAKWSMSPKKTGERQ
jgi:hypothetical protein